MFRSQVDAEAAPGDRTRVAEAPRILIFDEATSHLDASTSEQLADTINRIKGRVTVLFIAHQMPKGLSVDATFQMGRSSSA
jgi:subfamily B ATP-binding cassette protein HlyB/CyaB